MISVATPTPSCSFEAATGRPEVPDLVATRRCRNCGLIYLCPRPKPDAIAAYYPDDYLPFRPAIEDEPRALMRWARRRKMIRRRELVEQFSERRTGRILDVGCSTGLFLHEMDLGAWSVAGVELTASAAGYARDRFGIEVFEGMLEDADFAPASFDVITFWDVLEHVYAPSETLDLSASLLKPGGLVAINVPNWDSLDRRLFGRQWQGYDPPRHLYVFTRSTLDRLLRQAGLEPVAWLCFMPAYFTFILSLENWLAAKMPLLRDPIMRLLNLPGLRIVFEIPFALLNRSGRGGVISVFARKSARATRSERHDVS